MTRRTDTLMMAAEKNGPENEAAFTKKRQAAAGVDKAANDLSSETSELIYERRELIEGEGLRGWHVGLLSVSGGDQSADASTSPHPGFLGIYETAVVHSNSITGFFIFYSLGMATPEKTNKSWLR